MAIKKVKKNFFKEVRGYPGMSLDLDQFLLYNHYCVRTSVQNQSHRAFHS